MYNFEQKPSQAQSKRKLGSVAKFLNRAISFLELWQP